jgi:biofilm PGA synthesis protein PgaA
LTPTDEIALQGLIDTMMAKGETAEALSTLEGLADTKTGSLANNMLKARMLISLFQYTRALDWFDRLLQDRPQDAQEIIRQRDNLLAALPQAEQDEAIRQLKEQVAQGNPADLGPKYNYILCLVLFRRYGEAVAQKTALNLDYHSASPDKAYWYAWALFKSDNPAEAQARFDALIQDHPLFMAPKIGRIYTLTAQARYDVATREIEALRREDPDHLELLFAHAYLFESLKHYWDAIKVYDRMLELYPGMKAAVRLKLRAFSEMGASTIAADQASREMPQDLSLQHSVRNDQGIDRMNWDEGDKAVALLASLLEVSQARRHTFDYIAALNKAGDVRQVIDEYETLEVSGMVIPAWVHEIAAGAYIAEGRPQRALELYDMVLAESPRSSEARLGKFYALQELRRWKAAEGLLASISGDNAAGDDFKNQRFGNQAIFELDMMKGWLLVYQDRLKEADAYFAGMREHVPANLDVRNAQAHVYSWRGWPRRALEEFNIIKTLGPDYVPAFSGRLATMNTLNAKQEAREQLALHLSQHPDNRHLKKLRRAFEIEQMHYLRTEVTAQWDNDDSSELSLRQMLSTPLSLSSRLYSYFLWQPSRQDDEYADFRRVGVGMVHRFNADWQMDGAVSVGIDGEESGVAASALYTPTDNWSLSAYADTFSIELPRRARLADTKAVATGITATWRQSEWREASAGFNHMDFSDGNLRNEMLLGYEQDLWIKHDWKMRLFLDLYGGWNSKGDTTDYFNPERQWSLSTTHMTQQTVKNNDRHSFLHRLYLTLGNSRQKGYAGQWVGSIRYEQEHEFGDRHFLMLGIGGGRNVYDGEGIDHILIELIYQWRF